MQTLTTRSSGAWRALVAYAAAIGVMLAAALVGCGGGVDSGGTGAPTVAHASGPISGFGSVIVNGVHFDERSASIRDGDGNSRSRDDLKLGMTTEIDGSAVVVDANGVSGSAATSIVFASALLGPVAAVDAAAGSFTVLGQTVDIAPNTVFDESLVGGLAGLAVGELVEIYALPDFVTRHYVATRIERRPGATSYVLRAMLSNLNAQARTFDLGGLAVSYATLPGNLLPGVLANGQVVRVQLAKAPLANLWQATRIDAGASQFADRDEARLEGLVTSIVSSAQFSVDGVAIDASHASFPDGTAGLVAGARVRVEGAVVGQVIDATRVELRSDDELAHEEFEVDGDVSALDSVAKTFVVRGVLVDYSGSVEFRDGTASDLRIGSLLEVRGVLSTAGTSLAATRIRFRN